MSGVGVGVGNGSGSGGGRAVRARYRFVEWTLKAMAAMAVRYVGTCLSCGERSVGTADPDDVQLWCLKHAGATGHTGYELSTYSYFDAAPTGNPAHCPRDN